MNHPRLRLHSRPQSDVDRTSMHTQTSSVQLWELVRDKNMHLLRTKEAVDRLVMLYAQCYSEDRIIIIDVVGRLLTAEHIHPFSIMTRQLAKPGELDVTGWTSVAIGTLKNVCKRLGVEVIDDAGTGQEASKLEALANQELVPESEHEESLLQP
jgi:hypothetical protein